MIRHGQTIANAEGYAAGHLDTPLTQKGEDDANHAAHTIENLLHPPHYIVHSPLIRARDTATRLNHTLQLPLYSEKKLMEQHFGTWQQQPWSILTPLIAAGQQPPDGESTSAFYARALQGISHAVTLHQGTALIVTHGGVFDALWHHYNLPKIDVKNTEFYYFEIQE